MSQQEIKIIRSYIKSIKNKNIRDIQSSIYARYIDIEDIQKVNKKKCNYGFHTFQIKAENNRKNYFTKKERVNTSFVYFSSQSKHFTKTLNIYFDSKTTKKLVKKVFANFRLATKDNLPSFFLHLICTILGRYESITLTNCMNQLRVALERNYIQFSVENNFDFIHMKPSMWFQFCKIIIDSLQGSEIVSIYKETGSYKKKHKVDHISISEEFKSFSLYYEYKGSNMPLISKPNPFKYSEHGNNAHGGFLVGKTDLIVYNKEKSLMTRVGDETLSNLNYLQEVPYKINKKYLNYILNNFSNFLSDQGFSIHEYEDVYQYNKSFSRESFITYQVECNKITKIIETIEQACYLNNFPCFYFTVFLDFRMRTYYHGWPINPQGDSLARDLLMFRNQRKKDTTKELDVSASGLQIIGGLLLNSEYLKQTNFIQNKSEFTKKRRDLYSESLKKYLSKKSFKNEKHRKSIEKFFTRKVFKSIIMCYFYNETHFGLLQKLKSQVCPGLSVEFNMNEEVLLIRNFLKKEFREYHFLSELIKLAIDSSIKNQRAISLYKLDNEASQYYALKKVIRVDYYDRSGKRQKIRVSKDLDPLTVDKRKTRRATQPNFIHNLDSQILHGVTKKARESGIYIAVIHDCFIVHKKHEMKIKKWYYDIFCDLILSKTNNPLISFLERNLSETEYNEIHKNVQKLISRQKRFSLENYKMSPFILF